MSEKLTEQQAEEIADSLQNRKPDWFCPFINGTCRWDCVCYVNAEAVLPYLEALSWRVDKAYCSNAMFGNRKE